MRARKTSLLMEIRDEFWKTKAKRKWATLITVNLKTVRTALAKLGW